MTATPAPDQIGAEIGPYRIVAPLGHGGMGVVWQAEHALLGHKVAVKLLRRELSGQPLMVERFFAEARAASRLGDPGIVRVLDFGWHNDAAYLVMELLEGESVGARLAARGRLATADAVTIAIQTAEAMAAAHALGIVHRDLKPDNLFLARDRGVAGGERVKVLDFGVAKLLGDDGHDHTRTQTGVIVGTPTYMSPEQCRGAGGIDHRTDIYALGCVLFELVAGRPPFTGTTAGDLIASHLLETPVAPGSLVANIPPALDRLVRACLDKTADARPASMTAMAQALATVASAGVAATEVAVRVDAPRPAPRRSRAVAVIASAVVVVACGVTLAVTRPWRTSVPAATTAIDAAVDAAVDAAIDAGVDAAVDAAIDAGPDARVRAPRRGAGYDPYDNR